MLQYCHILLAILSPTGYLALPPFQHIHKIHRFHAQHHTYLSNLKIIKCCSSFCISPIQNYSRQTVEYSDMYFAPMSHLPVACQVEFLCCPLVECSCQKKE